MEFGIIDYVLIGLSALFALIGLKKGIVKQLTGGITFIASIVIAILVFKYVANYILTSDMLNAISEKFYGLVESKAEAEAIEATISTAGAEGVGAVLSQLKIPGFMQGLFTGALEETIASEPSMKVGEFVAAAFANKAIVIGSFILTFIVGLIVVGILVGTLRKIADLPGIKILDRLLGMVFTTAKWALFVCIVFALVTLLYKIPGIGDKIAEFVDGQIKFSDEAYNSVSKWVYLNNPILKAFSAINFADIISNVTGGGSGEEMALFIKNVYKPIL